MSIDYPRSSPLAEINLAALQRNLRAIRNHIPTHIKLIAVVKCDAYGHGISKIAGFLHRVGVDYFAVADLAEGVKLRKSGLDCPVLVLSDVPLDSLPEVVRYDLTASVSTIKTIERLSEASRKPDRPTPIHINVDTGMGRFGVKPSQVEELLFHCSKQDSLRVEGIYSHLSTSYSDDPRSERYTLRQIERFNKLISRLNNQNFLPERIHIGNSPGLTAFSAEVTSPPYNSLRVGTLFFGYAERPCSWDEELSPIAKVKTEILTVKEVPAGKDLGYDRLFTTTRPSKIAVLPIGYADGLHRDLGNTGMVSIREEKAPIIGKLALRQTLVDVTGIEDVKVGDPVTLVGEEIPGLEQAHEMEKGLWEFLLPLLQRSKTTYM